MFVPQSGGIDNRSGFLPDGLVKKKKRLFIEALFFVCISPDQAKPVVFWLLLIHWLPDVQVFLSSWAWNLKKTVKVILINLI